MTGPDLVPVAGSGKFASATGTGERGVAECLDAMRRAADVLDGVSGVTWLAVFPARGHNTMPRVHVLVDSPEAVHALADLEAGDSVVPAYDHGGGRVDPSWAGRVNGIWLHVGVDFDERSVS